MSNSTPEQLRFPAIDGLAVRGAFDGGALSSDFDALLLRGVDRQLGLTARLAAAMSITRWRHCSPIREIAAAVECAERGAREDTHERAE
ncbi:hypothetical protein NB231_12661 [Nitrococcus mobilis Nb-231]|uniref:Uncharacterized protein n=1 Tax=Nitrococcus mobilis Nb-231 TaxID=314278 RepID=A4BU67_9GAMM|nr:hypothetical protein NB231_12661 [Nitrococcus mobilis Nb-231]